jgi:hypothetical protein
VRPAADAAIVLTGLRDALDAAAIDAALAG